MSSFGMCALHRTDACGMVRREGKRGRMQMHTIGCHLSSAKGYLRMAKDAASIDANTFQFFTRNPRGGRAKAIDPADMAAFHAFAAEHGISRILAHAPYTLNPASDKARTCEFALQVLSEDLVRMEGTPHQLYTIPAPTWGRAWRRVSRRWPPR